MSLVAYGSSDEESDEDVQNNQDDAKKRLLTKEGKDPAQGKGLVLPSPKQTSKLSSSSDRKSALSSILPKPKNLSNIEEERMSEQTIPDDKTPPVSLETMLEDEEILEIEEEYEPIAKRAKKNTNSEVDNKPKSVGSLFSLLPAPWQAENTWQRKKESNMSTAGDRRSKQPVKIAIPTAPKNDSDEEDDMPAIKTVAPSKGGSGLKALLPKPKHSITLKSDNPNKPSVKLASRPLIPHTLTKKPTTIEKKPHKTAKAKHIEEATSDDEDEPVSFFTFNDKSESTIEEKEETSQSPIPESNRSVSAPLLESRHPPVASSSHAEMPSSTSTSHSSGKHGTVAPSPEIAEPITQATVASEEIPNQHELQTKTYMYYNEQQSGQSQQYGGYSNENYGSYNYDAGSSSVSQPYYSQETETYTYTYPTGTAAAAQAQGQLDETDLDLEKLHKLQGRRNRREEINIVDVNAADQIGDSAAMLAKYGTEEIAYAPSRKKKDMPTSQQRRKHQITYLAFQAKERELELRQQWSANRQTRRQTQSKYGF